MTYTTEFFGDGVVIRYSGRTTGEDILKAKSEFFERDFGRPARYILCDFTHVERFDVNSADVSKIVRQDLGAVDTHPGLAEVVIAPQPHQFGLARMWEIQVQDERTTFVARERDEALKWLEERGITVGDAAQHS